MSELAPSAEIHRLKAAVDAAVRSSPPAALPLAEALTLLASPDPAVEALRRRGIAVALHANGQSADALPHYSAAAELYTELGDEIERARVLRSLVDVLQMSGRSDEALACGVEAREILQRNGEMRLLAQLESNLGNVHFRLDRFDLAVEAYDRAVALFDTLGDTFGRAYARYNAGNVLTNAHRFDAAQGAFEEAHAAFVAGGHKVLAADARYALAYLDFRRGRWQVAIEALEVAREVYRDGGKPSGQWLCELDLAEIHLTLGAYRDAAEHAAAAAAGFSALRLDYELGRAALLEGVARARLGERERADRLLGTAEATFEALGNRVRGALVVLARAELAADASSASGMLFAVERARAALEASGDLFLARLGRLAEAVTRATAGQRSIARDALQRLAAELDLEARQRGEAGPNPLDAVLAIDAARALANTAESADMRREQLSAAVAGVEDTYVALACADARLAFFGARHGLYVDLAEALLDDERIELDEVIAAVERGRRRSLVERPLGAALADPEVAAARATLDRWLNAELEERLRGAARSGAPAPGSPPNSQTGDGRVRSPGAAAYVAVERAELEHAQRALVRRARRGVGGEPAVVREQSPMAAGRHGTLAADEALLYCIVGRAAVHIIWRHGAAQRVVHRPVTAAALGRLSERARLQAEKARLGTAYRARHHAQLERATTAILRELGELLFEPFAEELRALDGGALRIVPFGVLHELPLHAALVGGQPLYELATLALSRGLRAASVLPGRYSGEVLVCVDETAGLAAAEREVAAVRAAYAERAAAVSLDVLLERTTSGMDGPPAIVHLLAHGAHQPEHPMFSGMRFGSRFLTALDLERLDLGGALVIASGCETGRIAPGIAEDPHGPERSLFVAGASAVLGSLWPVEDDATAEFMAAFHGSLARSGSARAAYVDALRSRAAAGAAGIDLAAWTLALA